MKAINDILNDPVKLESLKKRYWPKVTVLGPDECWEWRAKATHPHGYGRMTAGRGTHLKAHHIGWALENGPIPEDLCVLHKCDNPGCSNPKHLFLGTMLDNMQDKIAKGRAGNITYYSGEEHCRSKLTDDERRRIAADNRSATEIADEFSISYRTVYRIRRNEMWAHP